MFRVNFFSQGTKAARAVVDQLATKKPVQLKSTFQPPMRNYYTTNKLMRLPADEGSVAGGSSEVLNAVPKFTPGVDNKVEISSEHLAKFMLVGKTAVVTGGARGLGLNMAKALCDCGVEGIALLDVLQTDGEATVTELNEKYNVNAAFYRVDVRNDDMVRAAMDEVVKDFGKIDALICSAGIADSNIPAETYDMHMFRRLIDINLCGTFVCAQAAGTHMINQKNGGSIVFIASMSGHIVNWPQQQSCYNASKAGVIQLGKSLAAEWAQYGIRVNSISPGYMDTELNRVPALDAQKKLWKSRTPMGRLGDVDELNNLAVFLASDASSFMTGSDILIDGGYTAW